VKVNNYASSEDSRENFGRGILVLAMKGLRIEKVLPKCNGDRLMICKVAYDDGSEFLLVAFHLD